MRNTWLRNTANWVKKRIIQIDEPAQPRKGDCGGTPFVGNVGDLKPNGTGRGMGGQGKGLGRGCKRRTSFL